jgi:hypothetical protein
MFKTFAKSAALSSIMLFLLSFTNKIASAAANCKVNGQPVDCAELGNTMKGFLGWGIGIMIVIAALALLSLLFWILMLIHALTHDIKDKGMWVILIVFTGLIGALIYYFVVKRNFINQLPPSAPIA